MAEITLDELKSIESCNNNDILLISRKNSNNNIYVSYTYKLKDMHKHISNDVSYTLLTAYLQYVDALNGRFNSLSNDLSGIISTHIIECYSLHELLSNDLTSEFGNLSTDLTGKMLLHEKTVALSIDEISSKFNELKQELITAHAKHEKDVNTWLTNLSTEIQSWVTDNFVSLTGDQRITGQKTFTRDIVGTATSARWA